VQDKSLIIKEKENKKKIKKKKKRKNIGLVPEKIEALLDEYNEVSGRRRNRRRNNRR